MKLDYLNSMKKYQKVTALALAVVLVVTMALSGVRHETQAGNTDSIDWRISQEDPNLQIREEGVLSTRGRTDFEVEYVVASSSDASSSNASDNNASSNRVTLTVDILNEVLEFYNKYQSIEIVDGYYYDDCVTLGIYDEDGDIIQNENSESYSVDLREENDKLRISFDNLHQIPGEKTIALQIHTALVDGQIGADVLGGNDYIEIQSDEGSVKADLIKETELYDANIYDERIVEFFDIANPQDYKFDVTRGESNTYNISLVVDTKGDTSKKVFLPKGIESGTVYRIPLEENMPIAPGSYGTEKKGFTLINNEQGTNYGEAYWDYSNDCILIRFTDDNLNPKEKLEYFDDLSLHFNASNIELATNSDALKEIIFNEELGFTSTIDKDETSIPASLNKEDGVLIGQYMVRWTIDYVHPNPTTATTASFVEKFPHVLYTYENMNATVDDESYASGVRYEYVPNEERKNPEYYYDEELKQGVDNHYYRLTGLLPGQKVTLTFDTRIDSWWPNNEWAVDGKENILVNRVQLIEDDKVILEDDGKFTTKDTGLDEEVIMKSGEYGVDPDGKMYIDWVVNVNHSEGSEFSRLKLVDLVHKNLGAPSNLKVVETISNVETDVTSGVSFVPYIPDPNGIEWNSAPDSLVDLYESGDYDAYYVDLLAIRKQSGSQDRAVSYQVSYRTYVTSSVLDGMEGALNKAWTCWSYSGGKGFVPGIDGEEVVFWREKGVSKYEVGDESYYIKKSTGSYVDLEKGIMEWDIVINNAVASDILLKDTTVRPGYPEHYETPNSYGNYRSERLHSFVDFSGVDESATATEINHIVEMQQSEIKLEIEAMIAETVIKNPNIYASEKERPDNMSGNVVNVLVWPQYDPNAGSVTGYHSSGSQFTKGLVTEMVYTSNIEEVGTNIQIVIEDFHNPKDESYDEMFVLTTYANYHLVDSTNTSFYETYNTTYPNPTTSGYIAFLNYVEVEFGNHATSFKDSIVFKADADIRAEIGYKRALNYAVKDVDHDGIGDKVITWKVSMSDWESNPKIREFSMTDLLSAGLTYVPNSFTPVEDGVVSGVQAYDSSGNVTNNPEITMIEGRQQLFFDVRVAEGAQGLSRYPDPNGVFTFETVVGNAYFDELLSSNGVVEIENNAVFALGDGLKTGSHTEVTIENNLIEKWGEGNAYNKGVVEFSILINPYETELLPGDFDNKYFEITDTSVEVMTILPNTAKITEVKVTNMSAVGNGAVSEGTGFDFEKVSGGLEKSLELAFDQNNQFTINSDELQLESKKTYLLEYTARVNDSSELTTITNHVAIKGYGSSNTVEEEDWSKVDITASGGIGLSEFVIEFDKINENQESISGAQFLVTVFKAVAKDGVITDSSKAVILEEKILPNVDSKDSITVFEQQISNLTADENIYLSVEETVTPSGYIPLKEPVVYKWFIGKDDSAIELLDSNVVITNEPMNFRFDFNKIGSDDELAKEGAEFKLTVTQGNEFEEFNTAGSSFVSFDYSEIKHLLNDGQSAIVTYEEMKAPSGYLLDAKEYTLGTISIAESGIVEFAKNVELTQETTVTNGREQISVNIKVPNDPITYGFDLRKVDEENTEKGLDGAIFQFYYDINGTSIIENDVLDVWTTDDDGLLQVRGIKHNDILANGGGIYYKELVSPNGYYVNEELEPIEIAKLNEHGELEFTSGFENGVQVENAKIQYEFEFTKMDVNDSSRFLDKAEFIVYFMDGAQVFLFGQNGISNADEFDLKQYDSITSEYRFVSGKENSEGKFTVEFEYEDLENQMKEDGIAIYYKEIVAPNGYELDDSQKLLGTLSLDGKEFALAEVETDSAILETEGKISGTQIVTNKMYEYGFDINKIEGVTKEQLSGAEFEIYVAAALTENVEEAPIKIGTMLRVEEDESKTHSISFTYGDVITAIPDFQRGNVYYKEVKVPLGYHATEEMVLLGTINSDGSYTSIGEDGIVVVENYPLEYKFNFMKLDGLSEDLLSRAEFEIYFKGENGDKLWLGEDGKISETPIEIDTNDSFFTFSTDETGVFSVSFDYSDIESRELLGQEIYYAETKAPNGYVIDATEKLLGKLNEDGTFTASESAVENSQIPNEFDTVIYNYREQVIQLVKVDSANVDTTLSGAQFEVYFINDNNQINWITSEGTLSEVQSIWTTQGNGMVGITITDMVILDELRNAMIYFRELAAPEGYELQSGEILLGYVLNEEGNWIEASVDEEGNLVISDTMLTGNQVTVTVENTETSTIETESTSGGGDSGGGGGGNSGSDEPPVTTITIGDTPVPLSSTAPPVIAPLIETIEDLGVPLAGFLPKTGYEDSMLFYGLGVVITAGVAITLHVRSINKKKEKQE